MFKVLQKGYMYNIAVIKSSRVRQLLYTITDEKKRISCYFYSDTVDTLVEEMLYYSGRQIRRHPKTTLKR